MNSQSWINSLLGGALIGLASGGLMLLNGRVAGISGIFHRTVEGSRDAWRWAFLLGLVLTGTVAHQLFPAAMTTTASTGSTLNHTALLIAAGLLVGFGTRMGSGCTSGHGICGLARLSPRSLVAVLVFLGTGITITLALRLTGAR